MILIASILGGSVIGYRSGSGGRATRLFLGLWLGVFAFQTAVLVSTADDPRNRDTGQWELGYFPFALTVLLLGLAVLHAAATLRRRRAARARATATR